MLPARRADGSDAVLKLGFPHEEAEHEAAALTLWDGDGAVRLLGHAPEDHALLLERCRPGVHLATLGAEGALDVLVGLLPRLWTPLAKPGWKPAPAPFAALADEATRWAAGLPRRWEEAGRPFERALVDAAVATLAELVATRPAESVLLHQDLHGHNVLAAQREPWLAIDPKPLAGERAFGAAPIVRSAELGHERRAVLRRLDRLCAELGLDRERARGWAFSQTLAWAFDGARALPGHVETARWLAGAQ